MNPPPPPPPPQSVSNSASSGAGGENKSSTFARTVQFVVFTGIAFSVIKSINPFDRRKSTKIAQPQTAKTEANAVTAVDPNPTRVNEPLPVETTTQPITQNPNGNKKVPDISEKTVEVTSGDTLWGLSRKHGVSIESIKQVNGLSGDTIHVGKKLIIP